MGIFIEKSTGKRFIARQKATQSQDSYDSWLMSLPIEPEGPINDYDWLVYMGEDKYRVLDDDEFDEKFEEPPTENQGG